MGTKTASARRIRNATPDATTEPVAPIGESPKLVSIPRNDATVTHADLKVALARMSSVIDRKSMMPILANVAIRSTVECVEMVGTDLDVYLTLRLASGKGSDRFGTTVAAHRLAALVKTLPAGEVSIARDERHARICAGPVTARLESIPDRDFPKIPTLGDAPWTSVDAKVLRAAIDSVMFSVCHDETRFHLNGARLESDGSTLTVVTTDGHRLTKVRKPWAWSGPSLATGIIVPLKGLQELVKLLKGADTCEIGLAKPYLFVRVPGAELAIKLTDAQFPPYEQVIPKDYRNLVTLAREPLRVALDRARLITSETRGVRIEVGDGKLLISSDNPDIGAVTESIPADYAGKAIKWGCNPQYVVQLLEEITGDSITLAFRGEMDPVLVRSTDDAAMRPISQAEIVGVVMPMRV